MRLDTRSGMDPYFYDKMSHFTLGIGVALFISGIINLSRLFKRFNKVPILIFWGLACLLISNILWMLFEYWLSEPYPLIIVVISILYPQAIFISFWLYLKRLQIFYLKSSLRVVIRAVVYITVLIELGDTIVYICQAYGVGSTSFYSFYIGFEFIYYLVVELFLFILLMQNVPSLIDLSRSRYRLILFVTFGILVTSDVANICMYYLQSYLIFAFISFFLRLNSVILYYDALKESTVEAASDNREIIEAKLNTLSGNSSGHEPRVTTSVTQKSSL